MDLQKAYDSLDQYMCLIILAAYGVCLRALRLLRTYWGRLTMVARAGGYYVPPFKGYCGVNQGETLYPTIPKVFVESVIRQWMTVVDEIEAFMEVLVLLMRYLAVYF